MKRFLMVLLAALLCGVPAFSGADTLSEPEPAQAETIHYQDISGDYLFIQNLSETEQMVHSLQDYLKDSSIQIQSSMSDRKDLSCSNTGGLLPLCFSRIIY